MASYNPTNTSRSVNISTTTSKDCRADNPPRSVAVTVIAAIPSVTPVTVTVLSDASTMANAVSEVVAE